MSTARKFVHGIGWGGLSMAVVAGCQIVFLAVLARLLSPSDFGLVALANISLRFVSYFAQLGVTPAIVQKPSLQADDLAGALAVSLGISLVAALVAVAAAPLAGHFFNMPQLSAAIMVLAIGFPVQGLGAVSTGLLRRQMAFRALGLIDAMAYVLGYGVVGIGLAVAGWGVWALVMAALAQTCLSTALTYAVVRHSLTLRHSAAARRHFVGYGGRYSAIGFLEFLSGNVDALAVGKVLGDASAGIYNRTITVANLPVQQPTTIISRALFPLLSAAGADRKRQAVGLQLSLLAVGGYAFAAAAAMSAAASPIVHTLLGPRWLGAIPVLQVFALSVGPRFLTHVVGISLDAMGVLSPKLYVQAACLMLMLFVVWFALPHGLVVVAAAVVAVEIVRAGLFLLVAARTLRGVADQWALTLAPLAVAAALSSLAVHGAAALVPASPHWLQLVCALAAGAMAIVATVLLCRGLLQRLDCIGWIVQKVPQLGRVLPQAA